MTMPIERVKSLLGPDAEGKTDEQLQRLAEDLGSAASAFYDEVQSAWKRDPDSVRWLVHASQTGESEDVGNDVHDLENDPEEYVGDSLRNYLRDSGETE
jgi:hypothetical protein